MIRGEIVMTGEHAKTVERALAPDDLPTIEKRGDEGGVRVCFKADRIQTLLQTVDDYLLNARIAEEISEMTAGMKRLGRLGSGLGGI